MRLKSLSSQIIVIFSILFTVHTSKAQSLDEVLRTEDGGTANEETCRNAPLNGADAVRVIVRGNENVLLVGTTGKTVVWKKQLPLKEEVNSAKTNPICKGRTIELYSQFPFSAYTEVYTFAWDVRAVKYVSPRSEDPSAETLE